MAATVDLPHRWYNVSYNIQLGENKTGIAALRPLGSQSEFVDYKIFTAQIALVGHLKLINKLGSGISSGVTNHGPVGP